jgi:dTMP kinase
LEAAGIKTLATKEPGGTEIGDEVRSVLLDMRNTTMHARTEVLLFQASRAQLVEQILKPNLEEGNWVLLDRFFDSTLAYQGFGHGQDLSVLRDIIEYATDGLKPDLTLLLDVDVQTGLRRKKSQEEWNRLDAMDLAFHQRVAAGYKSLAADEPDRWRVVDANKSITEVEEQIKGTVTDFFGLKAVGVLGINVR